MRIDKITFNTKYLQLHNAYNYEFIIGSLGHC